MHTVVVCYLSVAIIAELCRVCWFIYSTAANIFVALLIDLDVLFQKCGISVV